MKIGKLYQINKSFWYLYPTKDIAADAGKTVPPATHHAPQADTATYLSKRYNCNITTENSIFCLIEKDEKYLKVITSNGEIGWMIYPENENWTKDCFEEVKL